MNPLSSFQSIPNLDNYMTDLTQVQEWFAHYWWIFPAVFIWAFVWKGIALWKSARTGSKSWFVIFLIVNTLGILEILYVFIFSKPSKSVAVAQPIQTPPTPPDQAAQQPPQAQ
ncbi:MAG: hypothetical protein A3A33_01100 [Candidatus Yanofskybacteria bacterium RIFCSPLOWO2_01_FULL_49_25]|uniref:DUF5652 domain-containing protein n=1 Tax=Candidatus Yanofskybacteria bacterium RIFCSPLOWO2_01_FULL_49_25 TaxID=1802701 RepID=A0A1F8GVC6_9BACT|nr:MAG: hypothetical protein A3A33_01100 [Candidatus Yanofskybacteria bacterium RIFCSPLOWO2_01_FULL_49_25]